MNEDRILPEDNMSDAYMAKREQILKENSLAAEALRKHLTPEEYNLTAPKMGLQPMEMGTPDYVTPGGRPGIDITYDQKDGTGQGGPGGSSPIRGQEVDRILAAMKEVESGGDYSAMAPDGGKGAYQFMPDTWKRMSTQFARINGFGDKPLPMTPENEEAVAKWSVEEMVSKGYNVKQIAAIWNSGGPTWEGKKGVNSAGVPYDVEVHVGKVQAAYDRFAGIGGKAPQVMRPMNLPETDVESWRTRAAMMPEETPSPAGPHSQQMALDLLLMGNNPEEIEAEIHGGIREPIYGPSDLLADVAQGTITAGASIPASAARIGSRVGMGSAIGGAISSEGLETAARTVGKRVVTEAGTGALAGGAMTAADAAGAGPLLQIMAGVVGPTATMAMVQLPRKGLAVYLKNLEIRNPDVYKKLSKKIDDAERSGFADKLRGAFREARSVLRDETGAFGGQQSAGWDAATGKFSSLYDRKPRFEIDDSKAEILIDPGEDYSGNLQGAYFHPRLYDAYPELKNVPAEVHVSDSYERQGEFDGKKLTVWAKNEDDAKKTITHEIQHWIQEKEGFAKGGNPENADLDIGGRQGEVAKRLREIQRLLNTALTDSRYSELLRERNALIDEKLKFDNSPRAQFETYRRLAGEIEARDAAERANLTPEERAKTPPYSSENIPPEEAIVVERGTPGSAMADTDLASMEAKFKPASPEEFVVQRDKSKKNQFLTPYTPEEMKDWQVYLTDDGVGFALTPEKDMVGVINNSGRKGAGEQAVTLAIAKGARTCDCVAGFLDSYYNSFGFIEKYRAQWDDALAPKGWDYEKYGRPDIIFFEFPEDFSKSPNDTRTRLGIARSEGGPWRGRELWTHDRWTREIDRHLQRGVGTGEQGSPGGGTGNDSGDVESPSFLQTAKSILGNERGGIEITIPPRVKAETKAFENNPKSLFKIELAQNSIESAILSDKMSKPLQKYSININHERLRSPEDIHRLIETVAENLPAQIDDSRRGTQTQQLTKQLAMDLGWSEETLLSRRRGEAFNAEQVLAARWIMMDSAEKLLELAKAIRGGNNSDEMLSAFRGRVSTHAAIQAQVSGMTAEAGRALSIFNVQTEPGILRARQIRDVLEASGGRPAVEKMAEALADVADSQVNRKPSLAQVNRTTEKLNKATGSDMFIEAWIMGLLSGPQTHATNILSNAITALWMVPERKLASAISQSPIGSGEILAGEASSQFWGLVHGMREGFELAGKAFKTGQGGAGIGKLETPRKAITGANLEKTWLGKGIKQLAPRGFEPGNYLSAAVDWLGDIYRTPGKFLTSEDEFFKVIGYRMELNARAYRTAVSEGLEEEVLTNRISEIMAHPPDDLKLAAVDAAQYQTFTNPLGKTGSLISAAINSKPVLRLIVPFVRTPLNILKMTIERTPLAPLMSSVRSDLMAGGARRDLAVARIGLGSTVMAVTAALAGSGVITGAGPADKDMKEILRRKGWQPYSLKIGDTYYSYNRLDPIGGILAIAADSAEIMGQLGEMDANKLAGAAVTSVSQNLLSKTYCRGLSDFFAIFSEAQRYENANRGEGWIRKQFASLIPSLSAQINRTMVDPAMRETSRYKGFDATIAELKARIPGWSDDLPPRRNLWGEPVILEGGIGPDIVSPIYSSTEKDSPVDDEMLKHQVAVKLPSPQIKGVELTPQEWDRYVVLAGNEAKSGDGLGCKDALEKLVASNLYQRQSDGPEGGKAMYIRYTINAYRELAEAQMLKEFPDLRELAQATRQEKAQALKPKY